MFDYSYFIYLFIYFPIKEEEEEVYDDDDDDDDASTCLMVHTNCSQ